MVVATGFFDGVHLGHRFLIERLIGEAHRRGTQSLIVTFWPHPRNVLQNEARDFRLLSSMQEKKVLLTEMGVDRVEVLEFSRTFSSLTMRDYIRQVLIGRFGAKCLVLGYDNRMGCDCHNTDELADIAREEGLEVVRVGVVKSGRLERRDAHTGFISSTRIRNALAEGRVEDAASMLGRPYSLYGVVVAGNRLGRTIGFPTANMQLYEPLKVIPAPGVYAVYVNIPSAVSAPEKLHTLPERMSSVPESMSTVHESMPAGPEGKRERTFFWSEHHFGDSEHFSCSEHPFGPNDFQGMCNIGYRPTIGASNALTIETHILDFDEDIYGLDIHIHFYKRIREERKFDSLSALADQLKADREQVRHTLARL
ncbi:MAG: bifunctional riboflavin kinase/FMN adenylyltransferase [Bacteroidales bacterium]|nr:bifunctional riboflavin kinase/FMN adenylyltransferase [Bacteroidales bacterium]